MNLAQAEYFLRVAEKQSFTLAAKSLYVSQPALSRQISLLEQELGTKLLLRNNKRVSLTEAGEAFREDLQKIMKDLELAKERVRQIEKRRKKQIHISCFDGVVIHDCLPGLLCHIRSCNPDIHVEIERGTFRDIRENLAEDRTDLIVTLDFEKEELCTFEQRVLTERKCELVYSVLMNQTGRERKKPEDFRNSVLLTIDPQISPGGYRNNMEILRQIGLENVDIKTVRDMSTLMTYLEMGRGFAFLGGGVVAERNHLNCINLDRAYACMNVIAAWKRENELAAAVMNLYNI